ncbi:hypothetical protein Gasu2_49530 [Galdieria sulphuraria]|nr:hypothetical protein Gasu2_49530 [Galdieria sulphuraria]
MDSVQLLTEVVFEWRYSATSAFVTGTFNDWNDLIPMSRLQQGEDEVWRATKSLPAGVYQYKFIVDNVWRCAPEQPCVKDERGILNNIIHVTFKECDDKYCFCHTRTHVANSRWTCEDRNYSNLSYLLLLQTNDHVPICIGPYRNISRVSSIDEISSQKIDSGLMLSDFSAHNPSSSSNWENRTPKSSRDIVEAAAGNPLSIAISLRAKLSHPRFGFNPRDTHPDIILTDSNYCATKTSAALYRTCRTTFALAPDMNYYFEIYVAKHEGKGTCVGLSTKELPLNCLCGTRPNSVGFYTTGHLIRTVDGKPQWVKYGTETEADSIVGVFVRLQRNQIHLWGIIIITSMEVSNDHIHHFTVLEHLSEPVYGLDGRNIRIRRESSSESLHNELSMDLLDI